ncbi:hypothetical protein AB3480_00605 [Rhizobium mongolense]|uniref:hypothetical protein n=1 Tax=Rhizobium mongolense TaxID=57676 RepID=UPI0034A51BC8
MSTFFAGLLVAIITGGFFLCGLFGIAFMKNNSHISREEEERNPAYGEGGIVHVDEGTLEGDLTHYVKRLNSGEAA